MKKLFMPILCLLSLCPLTVNAQYDIDFSPDCPGATTGPDIMPQWKLDWETGLSHEWNRRNGAHERTWVINTSTFRLGLTSHAELRLQLDESATHTHEDNYAGISNASIGTKIKIAEGGGALPKISFLGTFLLPGNSHSNYLPQHIGVQTHLLFENELSNRFSLGYDIGAEWSGNTNNPDLFFGACLNYEATSKLSFFVESYNLYNSQKQDDWAKPGHSSHFNCMGELGAAYMVSPCMQVNLYGDINLNEFSKYANIGIGFAWLLN
ncbi:MAG TPA: transporter [Prevotella sp.]